MKHKYLIITAGRQLTRESMFIDVFFGESSRDIRLLARATDICDARGWFIARYDATCALFKQKVEQQLGFDLAETMAHTVAMTPQSFVLGFEKNTASPLPLISHNMSLMLQKIDPHFYAYRGIAFRSTNE